MKLTKRDDKIWLEKGWPDFAKHYSIKRGSMLMFRYEGNSEFHAVIFDTSTVEIDYPSIPVDFNKSDTDLEIRAPKEVAVEDDFVEILDDLLPCPKAREKYPSPCSQPHKKMRALELGATLDNRLTSIERARILERVPFESEKPFFKALMQPTYVGSKTDHLFIPLDFSMRYIKNQCDVVLSIPNGRSWFVEFKMTPPRYMSSAARFAKGWREFAKDNSLEVGDVCIFKLLNRTETSFEVSIVRFAEYERLQWSQAHKGGVIPVEPEQSLMNETKYGDSRMPISNKNLLAKQEIGCMSTPRRQKINQTINLSGGAINDEIGEPSSLDNSFSKQAIGCMSTPWKTSQGRKTPSIKDGILERVPFESEKPFFKVLMQQSHVGFDGRQINVPLDLAEEHIKNEGDVVLLTPNGRSWSAKFRWRCQKHGRFAGVICRGWNQFMVDNGLVEGDVCILELLNGTKISFQAHIFRAAYDYKCQRSEAGDFAKGAHKTKGDNMIMIEID